MKTINKILCITGTLLSFAAFLFFINAISQMSNENGIVLMSILAALSASIATICAMIFSNQRLFVFKNIFENANDAVTIINAQGKYVWQNRSNKILCGFDDNEISHNKPLFYINEKKISVTEELTKISEFSGIFSIEAKERMPRKVWISAFRVDDELGNTVCFVEMKRNVSEFLKLLEQTNAEKERLDKKVKNDFLTGVYNRMGFLAKIEEKIGGTIAFVDIDKFKDINDMFGHAIGDETLKSVANIISSNLRSSDIICRWGGEEFILWIDANEMTAFEICEKIRQKIESARPGGILTTCSFGIAKMEKNFELSIQNADNAMYFVKQNGRNSIKVFENNNQNP